MKKGLTNWFFDGIIAERSEGGAANRTGFKKKLEEIRKKFLTNG